MEDRFIPGIYNYCDRWCERCRMTARCRVFSDEQEMTEEQKDIDNQAFWDYLNESLQQALNFIHDRMEELGLDRESFEEDAGISGQKHTEAELSAEQLRTQDLAKQYYEVAKRWFKHRQGLFKEKENSFHRQLSMGIPVMPEAIRLSDALEIINWYSFFIFAKLRRALNGLHDDYELEESPVQNDANGSAKITLISLERSIAAWEVVRSFFPEASDELLDILVILGKLRREIHDLFPFANAFVRPGFDEPEYSVS